MVADHIDISEYSRGPASIRLKPALAVIEKWLDREKDQLPLWFPVGVGCGIALWQITGDAGLLGALLCCAALVLLGWGVGQGKRLSLVLFGAAAAVAAGFAAIAIKSSLVAAAPLPQLWIGEFYGRIEKVEKLTARDAVRLQLATSAELPSPRRVRVNLSPEQFDAQFVPGAVVKLRARLMPPADPALPGGFDFARRAWFQGLGATGTALGPVTLHAESPAMPLLASTRDRLTQHILHSMPGDAGAIGAALITGDQGHISEADAEAMRNSGMAHLLSISGLHVTAVVGFTFLLVSRSLSLWPWFALRVPIPLIAAGVAAATAVGYTLLTGAEVPTIRSCIAALLVLVALALGRDALTLRLVAFGALIVLLFWPEAMAGPSFQLSFAAVATIVVLHDLPWMKRFTTRREEPLAVRAMRALASLVITGIAIELLLAPIALYHFHKAGLYGALANVLAIPLTTFFIMPLEALALLFDALGAGAPFWWVAAQGIGVILSVAHLISALPGAISTLPAMPDWAFAAIIAGALIGGLLKTKVRLLGIIPFVTGIAAMLMAPRPDLLITGDGKHLAVVAPDGRLALLRAGAGDYIRDMLLENAGTDDPPMAIESWPGATCSIDSCVIQIWRNQREWRILATRTPYRIDTMEMAAACRRVDIVISDRWLPASCRPAWIKADRNMLEQSGGLAIYLGSGRIDAVNAGRDHLPWVAAAREANAAARPYQ